jgi:hypothetical protein
MDDWYNNKPDVHDGSYQFRRLKDGAWVDVLKLVQYLRVHNTEC